MYQLNANSPIHDRPNPEVYIAMSTRAPGLQRMRLSEWARNEGISRITAYRMLRRGILPVNAEQSPTGRWYVLTPTKRFGRTAIYARAGRSRYQVEVINNQISSLSDWAAETSKTIFTVVKEIANPLTDPMPNLERLLYDTQITEIVIHNPDVVGVGRLPLLIAALAPQSRVIRAVNPASREDDLQERIEELAQFFD